jgi:hypothetical protein
MYSRAAVRKIINRFLARYDIRVERGADIWHANRQLGRQPEPPPVPRDWNIDPFCRTYVGNSVGPLQRQFDFAVVVPSVLRPTLKDAIASVFAQNFSGRVQVLIGIDAPLGDLQALDQVCRNIPPRHTVQIFYPGYSTSRRHRGVHFAWDGGALRTILSYLANSQYISYLDDDNWYADYHLASMYDALQGHDWAYSFRWYVHPASRRPICEDRWESIGPVPTKVDSAGWVDPNCLAIDKLACEAVLPWWSIPQRNSAYAMDADRHIFRILRTEFRGRGTNQATVYYTITESDPFRHPLRLELIGAEQYAAAGLMPSSARSNSGDNRYSPGPSVSSSGPASDR